MKRISILLCITFLAVIQSWGGTITVGLDDAVGMDYDYQDLVMQLSGSALAVKSVGTWSAKPALNAASSNSANTGLLTAPFWNQVSWDGSTTGIGYCVWGGGACNGGNALDANALFLAADAGTSTGSANDVTFSASGTVTLNALLHLAGGTIQMGWYSATDPAIVHWLNDPANTSFTSTFVPGGEFGLVGYSPASGNIFYSNETAGGTQDAVSHYAIFADLAETTAPSVPSSDVTPTPEPGSIALLLGAGVIGGLKVRRSKMQA